MKEKILTVSGISSYNRPEYPFIRLSGKWLMDLGFKVGDKIIVQFAKGNLSIRVIDKD